MGHMRFQVGDAVRVSGSPNSPWRGSRGVIVEMIQRPIGGDDPETKEYAVRFAGEQRSLFLGEDLVKAPPDKLVRFFRSEVTERLQQVNRSRVGRLDLQPP